MYRKVSYLLSLVRKQMNGCFQRRSDILTLKFDSAFMLLNTMHMCPPGLSGITKKNIPDHSGFLQGPLSYFVI